MEAVHTDLLHKCIGDRGFVVALNDLDESQKLEGVVDPETGSVDFSVTCGVFVMRPIAGQCVVGLVTGTHEYGLNVMMGPLSVLVPIDVLTTSGAEFDPDAARFVINTTSITVGCAVRVRIMQVDFKDSRIVRHALTYLRPRAMTGLLVPAGCDRRVGRGGFREAAQTVLGVSLSEKAASGEANPVIAQCSRGQRRAAEGRWD